MLHQNKNREIVLATSPLPYCDDRSSSLGLGLLLSSLRREGYENVEVVDAAYENLSIQEVIDRMRLSLRELSFFGLSVLPSSIQSSRELMCAVRESFGERVELCLGGYLPTSYKERTFEIFRDVDPDYVVMGRGEEAILDILQYGKTMALPNVITNRGEEGLDGGERGGLDFSKSPWPDRGYGLESLRTTAQVYRLVGCPGNCNFCGIHDYANDTNCEIIQRTTIDFVDEMEVLHREYGIKFFDILDEDALGENPEEWYDIINELEKRDLKGRIKFWLLSRVPVVAENEKLIGKMAEAGLVSCFCGLESFSERQLFSYNKVPRQNILEFLRQARKSKEILEDAGVIPKYGFIPLDAETTLEEYIDNISKLIEYGFLYYVSELTKRVAIYPGSRMERIYERKGLLLQKNPVVADKCNDRDWIINRYNYRFIDSRVGLLSDVFNIWFKSIIQGDLKIKKAMARRLENPKSIESVAVLDVFKMLRDVELAMITHVIGMTNRACEKDQIVETIKMYVEQYHDVLSRL